MRLDALLGADDGDGMQLSPESAAGTSATNKPRAAAGSKKGKDKFAGLSVDDDVDFFSAFSVDQLQDELSPPKAAPAPRKPLVPDDDGGDDLEPALADEGGDPLLQPGQQQHPATDKAAAAAAAAPDTAEPATAVPERPGRLGGGLHTEGEGAAAEAASSKSSPTASGLQTASMGGLQAAAGRTQAPLEGAATPMLLDDLPETTTHVQPASPARGALGAVSSAAAAAADATPANPAAGYSTSNLQVSQQADKGPAAVMQTSVPQDNSMGNGLLATGNQNTTTAAAAPAGSSAAGQDDASDLQAGQGDRGSAPTVSASAAADHAAGMELDTQDPTGSKLAASATNLAPAAAGAPIIAGRSSSKAALEPHRSPSSISSVLAANMQAAAPAVTRLPGAQAHSLLDTAGAAAAAAGGGSGVRKPTAAAVPKPVASWQRPGLLAGATFPSALRGSSSKAHGASFAAPKPGFFPAAPKPSTAAHVTAGGGATATGTSAASQRPAAADLQSNAKKPRTMVPAAAAPAAGKGEAVALLTPLRTPAASDVPDASQQYTPGHSSTHGGPSNSTPAAAAVLDHLMSAGKSAAEAPARAGAGRHTPLEDAADMEVDVLAAGAAAAAGQVEEGDVLQTTLAADFTDHIKRLETMLLEAQGMQERVLELRVQAAITSNRLVRLNNPATARKLATLHAALQASS